MNANSARYRRAGFHAAALCAVAALSATQAAAPAQAWKPQQPLEIIVGSAAGSSPDTMARAIQRIWQEKKLVEFSNYRRFIGAPGLTAAQVAYWEGVLAGLDRDESWQGYRVKNQLDRRLMTGREALKYMEDLDGPIRAVLGELGLLK